MRETMSSPITLNDREEVFHLISKGEFPDFEPLVPHLFDGMRNAQIPDGPRDLFGQQKIAFMQQALELVPPGDIPRYAAMREGLINLIVSAKEKAVDFYLSDINTVMPDRGVEASLISEVRYAQEIIARHKKHVANTKRQLEANIPYGTSVYDGESGKQLDELMSQDDTHYHRLTAAKVALYDHLTRDPANPPVRTFAADMV